MKSDGPNRIADLLHADLKHFGESLWRNDETGERRFNFFLTLTTSVIAGLAALYAAKDGGAVDKAMLPYVARAALAGLFIFGGMTYLRLLQKNRVTDEYHKTLGYIRDELAKLDPEAKTYKVPRRIPAPRAMRWLKGGLAQMAGVMTAGLFALLVYSFVSEVRDITCPVALAIGAGSVLAIGLVYAAIRGDA